MSKRDIDAIERGLPGAHCCNDGVVQVTVQGGKSMQTVVVCPICAAWKLLAEVKRLRAGK